MLSSACQRVLRRKARALNKLPRAFGQIRASHGFGPDLVANVNFCFIWLHNPEEMNKDEDLQKSWYRYLDLLIERKVLAVEEVRMCFVNVDELFAMRERSRMQI